MPDGALTFTFRAYVAYIASFRVRHSYARHKVGHDTEYAIPTYNILVFD